MSPRAEAPYQRPATGSPKALPDVRRVRPGGPPEACQEACQRLSRRPIKLLMLAAGRSHSGPAGTRRAATLRFTPFYRPDCRPPAVLAVLPDYSQGKRRRAHCDQSNARTYNTHWTLHRTSPCAGAVVPFAVTADKTPKDTHFPHHVFTKSVPPATPRGVHCTLRVPLPTSSLHHPAPFVRRRPKFAPLQRVACATPRADLLGQVARPTAISSTTHPQAGLGCAPELAAHFVEAHKTRVSDAGRAAAGREMAVSIIGPPADIARVFTGRCILIPVFSTRRQWRRQRGDCRALTL